MPSADELAILRALPLEVKIQKSKQRIREWKNWNPKKIWVPSKHVLGLGKVISDFNEMYQKNKISLP